VKVVFIFIDGVGLRAPSADNPVNPAVCPALCRLINDFSVPIDTCLDVAGLPQSATGQATLYTGLNAAQAMGRHMEGFPGPSLRTMINAGNILMALRQHDRHCRFADAYMADDIEEIRARRFKSVTTVMTLTRPETMSLREDLLANQAVFHDITRASLVEKGYAGPVISPAKAAEHLIQIALANDFTLFEYFLTDLAGHSRQFEQAVSALATLDAFLHPLAEMARETGLLFVLTSDHGNIEDMSHHSHTANAVPLVAFGPGADVILKDAGSLMDVTPRLVRLLTPQGN
jgi:2,3-bisphosphoglycerate-independent phosphoglycerate mutase